MVEVKGVVDMEKEMEKDHVHENKPASEDVETTLNDMWADLSKVHPDFSSPNHATLREKVRQRMISLCKDSNSPSKPGVSSRTRSRQVKKAASPSNVGVLKILKSASKPQLAGSTQGVASRKRRRTNSGGRGTSTTRARVDTESGLPSSTTQSSQPVTPSSCNQSPTPSASESVSGSVSGTVVDTGIYSENAGGEIAGRGDVDVEEGDVLVGSDMEERDEPQHQAPPVVEQRLAKLETLIDHVMHEVRDVKATTTKLGKVGSGSTNFIKINVGGTVFTTRKSTLSRFEGTFLSAIASGFFQDELDENGNVFIDRDPKHFQFILNWLRDPSAPQSWPVNDQSLLHELAYFGLRDEVYKGAIYVAYGFDGASRLSTIECFSPLVKKWQKIAEFKCELSSPACAPMGGKMYITGGKNAKNRAVGTVAYFDPYDKQIHITTDLQIARFGHGLVELDDHIYAVGGYGDDGSRVALVEKYNETTKQWTDVPRLIEKRSALGCDALKGKIYVAGGYGPGSGNTLATSVEVYNPKLNAWAVVSPLNTPRAHVCCIAFQGQLWAIGGYDGGHASHKVEIYNPEKNEWKDGPALIRKRSVVVCAVLDNELYAIGGYDGQNYLSCSEVYSPSLEKWIHGPEMLTPRGRHCVCTLPI
eukprot:m.140029 g.140029  ORF g.140029 m.140029 type:complete len:645 (+) comp30097_c0_seq2:138-2072(+)